MEPTDSVFFEDRPAVIVVSHHRSGTHFLMNSIASCYGYISHPWIDLDPFHHTPIGGGFAREMETIYYSPTSIADYLLELAKRPLATTIKSHHPADFFVGALERIVERYVIFVVHRHPADTLLSFWRFLGGLGWHEGPKAPDPVSFAKSEPSGALLRYQMRQYPTMMHRWADAVEGWIAASAVSPRVVMVRYDQLESNFGDVMLDFAPLLGRQPRTVDKPGRETSPWLTVNFKEPNERPDIAALRALCRQTVGATMDRLGYG